MPQLSLYLDDDTMDILRQDATREGVSLSKHASRVIRENNVSAWPKGFFDLYGALDRRDVRGAARIVLGRRFLFL